MCKIDVEDGAGDEIRTRDILLGRHGNEAKILNKLSVTELAELSNFSKSYISQVKNGKCPPSPKLIEALKKHRKPTPPQKDYFKLFMQSRQAMGVSSNTLEFYWYMLSPFMEQVEYMKASSRQIERYLNTIPSNRNGLATRNASFRAIKTFYRWLSLQTGIRNPIHGMQAPILSKPILPSLTQEQVEALLSQAKTLRDKTVIALFTESGMRLTELANLKIQDIDWQNRKVKVIGKGRKEGFAPFGELSEMYLKELVNQSPVHDDNIWGTGRSGIASMLRRLEAETGITCNPHTFRRTFACLLRKAGVDTMTIKDLGRWESLEMVQRYTRSITFEDSLKHYKAPLS